MGQGDDDVGVERRRNLLVRWQRYICTLGIFNYVISVLSPIFTVNFGFSGAIFGLCGARTHTFLPFHFPRDP